MDANRVFIDGSLVDLNIRVWTGEKRLQPEDLGMGEENVPDNFTLGTMRLISDEIRSKFKHIDYEARSWLVRCSLVFPFGEARFVPNTALMRFLEQIDKISVRFNQCVEELISKYDYHKLKARPGFLKAAHEAYERLNAVKTIDKTRDEFINDFLERINGYYPDVSILPKKFGLDYQVYKMALPDLSQVTYADIVGENEKIRLAQEALNKKLTRKIEEFITNVVGELRSRAEVHLIHVRENIKKNKKITVATVNMLKDMIEDYRSLNIVGDAIFVEELNKFESMYLKTNPKLYNDNPDIRSKLLKSVEALCAMAQDQVIINELSNKYKERTLL